MAELYIGCLAAHAGREVVLDSPTAAKGDNPDILFRGEAVDRDARTWALAVKTISSRQGQTIYDRIFDGARQIDRDDCPADVGMVVINTKNALDHDALWSSTFLSEEQAGDAIKRQVFELVAAAEEGRDQAEWNTVFAGRTVRPVLFLAQSLVTLPTLHGLRTPTALKMLFAHAFGGQPDGEGLGLASLMNEFMQSVLLGKPGGPDLPPS
jgi:hypothetical protein